MTTIAVVSAGLSERSSTRLLAGKLASAVQDSLPHKASVEMVDLREHAHDVINALLTGVPTGALGGLVRTVADADALIAVTPVFNASYSGLFKSFFDILETDSLAGKHVLMGATGGTERHSLVLEHALRPMFAYLRAVVVPTAVYAATSDWGGASGLEKRIALAGKELADLLAHRAPSAKPDRYANVTPFAELLGGLRK
ncbi:FMN reductase [Allokutzneria sp. A3M-2-11 16]|uniref:FMN reductase n=1 Tax=Allokutzneria sp. A3M-2-11 16 TaxID=2962043 RepID=UPI0020B6584D|nr:FMN reductase [Allokutzneria sp. A3M-2-11 16]MCP3805171.1 FMN reductase [Allokutzneria sp. A3M-2-11 16]